MGNQFPQSLFRESLLCLYLCRRVLQATMFKAVLFCSSSHYFEYFNPLPSRLCDSPEVFSRDKEVFLYSFQDPFLPSPSLFLWYKTYVSWDRFCVIYSTWCSLDFLELCFDVAYLITGGNCQSLFIQKIFHSLIFLASWVPFHAYYTICRWLFHLFLCCFSL